MQFENDHLYHIYNRGNNSQTIFFTRENYLFFLEKIKKHILPHADILAWCLMPNHFHLMIYVRDVEIEVADTDRMTPSHPISKRRTLNNSIAIILRSYTRAIQKQEQIHGSLFQAKTKAICLTQIDGVSPAWFQTKYGAIINVAFPEKEYPQVCFDYIHSNPVKHGFVKSEKGWEFSSAKDYYGEREGKLINLSRTEEFGLVYSRGD